MEKHFVEQDMQFLPNYLLDLIESQDKKESSLYLNNAGWLVDELWSEFILYNGRNKRRRLEFFQSLDVSPHAVYGYRNNRKAISINMLYSMLLLWKFYCNKSDLDVKQKWDALFFRHDWTLSTHSKHQKTTLPKGISPDLAYLMGWMVGDGSLKESHNYLVKISEKSTDQLKLVIQPLFMAIFGIHAPIFRRYMNGYAVQVGSKPIYRFMKNILKIRTGIIPPPVWHFSDENKKHFLMGVFDAEGHVSSSYLNRRVVVSQADASFLDGLSQLFLTLGVKFNRPVKHTTDLGTWYSIQVRSSDMILRFCSVVGSRHIDKKEKIKTLVREIEKKRKH